MRRPLRFRRRTRRRAGFTLPELLAVLALAAIFIVLLQRSLIAQLRFYDAQRAAADRHESVRFAMAVLGGALREARVPEGDATVLATRRLRVRVPHGFGVVCGTNNNGGRLGVADVRGRWTADVGDSVLVHSASGRRVAVLNQIDPPSRRVPCIENAPGMILRVNPRIPDALSGVPARSFRSQTFESVSLAGHQWLYRVDGVARELLVGPLDDAEGFRVWYTDDQGVPVGPAVATRVAVRLIVQGRDLRGRTSPGRDTLLLSFGGMN